VNSSLVSHDLKINQKVPISEHYMNALFLGFFPIGCHKRVESSLKVKIFSTIDKRNSKTVDVAKNKSAFPKLFQKR
jgi:hypothetical protein